MRALKWVVAMLLLANCAVAQDSPRKPNIILIMADDFGYEIPGCNGGETYSTPNLDRMAAAGIRFEHCYSTPLCTPSRVQIMTGFYGSRNYTGFAYLDPRESTFGHILQSAGYATAVVGKWQLNGRGPNKMPAERGARRATEAGFDEYCLWNFVVGGGEGRREVDTRYANPRLNINGEDTGIVEGAYGPDRCVDFIEDFMRRHKDGPFFVYYPMILAHPPFFPTPDSEAWQDPATRQPDLHAQRPEQERRAYFSDMVSYLDKLVGRIRSSVHELGVSDDTIIIFTADNGTTSAFPSINKGMETRGAKGSMTTAGIHVPLLVDWPGVVQPGSVNSDLVDFTDFVPTIMEVADANAPSVRPWDGRSFAPQLRGEAGRPRDWIYCWYFRDAVPENRGGNGQGGEFASTKRYKLYASGEFYDMEADPDEASPRRDESLSSREREVKAMLRDVIARCTRDGFYD